jgi:hypothetical protein
MSLDPELVALLRCPTCRGTLETRGDALVCGACQVLYPVREGCPSFLPEEARPLAAGEA